jgi:hypothetical protein
MANWVRMMGVTPSSGPSFAAPLAPAEITTRASPTRQGSLFQGVGTRMGMPEAPSVPRSPYQACGGPAAGGGLAGLPVPQMVPPSQRPPQVNRGLQKLEMAYAFLEMLSQGWASPNDEGEVTAFSIESEEDCPLPCVGQQPLETASNPDHGMESEGPPPSGECELDGAPKDPNRNI